MEEKLRRKKIIIVVVAVAIVGMLFFLGVKYLPGIIDNQSEDQIKVSVEIDCKELSNDTSKLVDNSVKGYIPKDGMILEKQELTMKKGDVAFDVLEKVCKSENIQLDYSDLPSTGKFIEGLNYLYQKNAGGTSGWVLEVNGKMPDIGASYYQLKDGDSLRWYYSIGL